MLCVPDNQTSDAHSANSSSSVATSWGAIKIGLYSRHLERWLRFFPPSQLHFVHGERLVTDPAAELALLQDFLGLSRYVNGRHFYFNATKGFPCIVMRNSSSSSPSSVLSAPSGWTSSTSDESATESNRRDGDQMRRRRRRRRRTKRWKIAEDGPGIRCLGKTKGRVHPVVDETTLTRLRDFFRPFNEKFYRMTGIDFGWP